MWKKERYESANVQKFTKGNEKPIYAPIMIGDRYEVKGILSASGGFGIILEAIDTRLSNRKVLVKARRYDNEAGLFSYKNDCSRKEKIEKIRKTVEFEYDCLIAFRKQAESRMPNVNDIVCGFSPSLHGPHKSIEGDEFTYDDMDICNSEPYIIMQMIDGKNLGDYLANGIDYVLKDRDYENYRSWERDVLQYALEICTILNEFHKKNRESMNKYYIYQDLKPDNIMITDDLFVTLLDFGGMTIVAEDENGNPRSNIEGLGSPGLGTYGYKPPEMGDPSMLSRLDQRVDVYAFGATLYHLLTGDNLAITLEEEYSPIPIENLKKMGCTDKTYSLIEKCTKQNRDERYESMYHVRGEIFEALKEVKKG